MRQLRFQRIQTSNEELNLLQNRIAESFDAMTSCQLLGGNLLQQVSLKTGSNLISHGLGRNYISFLQGNSSAPVNLSYGASPDRSKYINIVASAPCSVDLFPY